MTEEELYELVEHELKWLKYYTHRDSRLSMTIGVDFYKDLKPMGYVKQMMSLEDRCVPCFLTCSDGISEGMDISKLVKVAPPRTDRTLTPLETVVRVYPDKKLEYIEFLTPKKDDPSVIKTVRSADSRRKKSK